jgi:hypothetical protein
VPRIDQLPTQVLPHAASTKEARRTQRQHMPPTTPSAAASRNSLVVSKTQTTASLLQPSSCAPQSPSYTTAACWLRLLASRLTAALLPARLHCTPACCTGAEGTPLASQFWCTLSHAATGCLKVGLRQPRTPVTSLLAAAGCCWRAAWLPACQAASLPASTSSCCILWHLVHLQPHIHRLPASEAATAQP